MNLPFGLPNVKDIGNKMKEDAKEITATYEHKLAEYRDTLEYYRKWLLEYSDKREENEHGVGAHYLKGVQTAMDLTYIKEQGEKTMDMVDDLNKVKISNILRELEKLNAGLETVNENLNGLDRNVVNRISELLIELQKQSTIQNKQYQADIVTDIYALDRRVRRGHALLWFVFIFNLIGISGIAFLILYVLEIIPF
ncbi:MAG: hypothetical protein K0R34_420 [Herbinix sp.]|jgi:hypothetical protein|nr:hypothetical protein [Herbinix sp.]